MLLLIARRRSQELNRQKGELETEVARRLTSEAEVLALNHELTRKIADFKTLLDVIPIGIAVAEDAECRVVRPNPALAAVLGVAPGTNISNAPGAVAPLRLLREGAALPPEKFPMSVAAANKAPALGEELQLQSLDGTLVDSLSFAAPVFDGEGRVSGVINAFVDITDRKSQERMRRELEYRLQRSERMQSLGVMAAGIAHDFNNLLAGVIGQASLAAKVISAPAEAEAHIQSSLAAAERAAGLVKKVLAYTGQSFHLPRRTNLADLVRKSEPSLQLLAANKTELQFRFTEPAPAVLADSKELQRALHNVVLNALEAADPAPGRVEVSVDSGELGAGETGVVGRSERLQPGRYVWIEVKDNGAGMPPDVAEKAFDPFFTTKFLGRGLGLAEVLGIMRSHGGAVQLKTEQGVGTSVRLLLPVESPGARVQD
jgi:signal transduction histidine kinase